jgi:hypothetical protein
MPHCPKFFALTMSLVLAAAVSCQRGPAPVKQPYINASQAGKLAMEQYDKDGDGKVAGDELENAPSLKAALKNLDTDGDGAVSADEVTARVNAWKDMKTAMTSVSCRVTLNGQPLGGAKVTLEPEAFLGEAIKAASDTTDVLGSASPTIPKDQRPDPKLPGGVNFGLYKVRISKLVNGQETIPARFNSETKIGQEVSYDDPGTKGGNIVYALKTDK